MPYNNISPNDFIHFSHNDNGSLNNNNSKGTKSTEGEIDSDQNLQNAQKGILDPVEGSATKSIFGTQPTSELSQQSTFKQSSSPNKHNEPANENQQIEQNINEQIDDEQRSILEGEARAEDIQDIRSSYEGSSREQR